MRTGDVITVIIRARRHYLTLDAHATPDPTMGQYEEGFWSGDPDDDETSFFVSSNDGSVYGWEPRAHAHTLYVGTVESVSTPREDN